MADAAAAQTQTGPGARPLIIGGSDVEQGRYPYVVSLRNGPERGHFCGGSLVAPSVVLTAAHCVVGIDTAPGSESAANLSVAINRADHRNTLVGEDRRVAKEADGTYSIFVHPEYDKGGGTLTYDVAVVVLDEPVADVAPIQLPSPASDVLERPGTLLTVAGWGNLVNDPFGKGQFPQVLQSVAVPVIASWECSFAYPGEFVNGIHVCAGVAGRDACQGDSGGPLFAEMPGSRMAVQAGVVSWGANCASAGLPGVYTRLADPKISRFVRKFTGL